MDYTHEATPLEILIEISEAVVKPEDLLMVALDNISKLRCELMDANSKATEARVEARGLATQVEALEDFQTRVKALHPDIELDILRRKLSGE